MSVMVVDRPVTGRLKAKRKSAPVSVVFDVLLVRLRLRSRPGWLKPPVGPAVPVRFPEANEVKERPTTLAVIIKVSTGIEPFPRGLIHVYVPVVALVRTQDDEVQSVTSVTGLHGGTDVATAGAAVASRMAGAL